MDIGPDIYIEPTGTPKYFGGKLRNIKLHSTLDSHNGCDMVVM